MLCSFFNELYVNVIFSLMIDAIFNAFNMDSEIRDTYTLKKYESLLINHFREFMLQGTQTINNQVINLTDTEEFDDNAIFFRGGAGLSYPLTETSSVYLQYLYGQSLGMNDDNNGSTSQEELKINTHMVGIGIRIAIPSKDTDVDNNEESEE